MEKVVANQPGSRYSVSTGTALSWASVAAFSLWSVPVFISLHSRWLNAGFEHGYPIAFLTLALIVMAIRKQGLGQQSTHWTAVPLLLGLLALSTLGNAATVAIIPALVLPIALIAFIWGVWGMSLVRRLAAPILFIYFAIPFWQLFEAASIPAPSLNESLRQLTTLVASALVHATDIPAYIEGDFIHIGSGVFEIADGCSGRGYFIVGLELCIFYCIAFLRRFRSMALLTVLGSAAALVGNWIRVYAIIVIGHVTDMTSPIIKDHGTLGWIVFGLIFIPVLLYASRLELSDERAQQGMNDSLRTRGEVKLPVLVAVIVTMIAFALVNARIAIAYTGEGPVAAIPAVEIDGWTRSGEWPGDGVPDFKNAGAERTFVYVRGRDVVSVYLANYPVQGQGREAIYFANRATGSDEVLRQAGRESLDSAEGHSIHFEETVAGDGRSRRVVWHGVAVAGSVVSGPLHAKFLQIAGVLNGRSDAQVLVLSVDCDTATCDQARSTLAGFAEAAAERLFDAAAGAQSTT